MDKKITVRFYRITRRVPEDVSFSECLQQIARARLSIWVDIDDEITIRMERFNNTATFCTGEFSRKQTENVPPRAGGDNEVLEPNDDELAHLMAFQYHPITSVIAVEVNRNGMSIGRVNSFIKANFDGHEGFDFEPVLTQAAWQKFNRSEPRRFAVAVAAPENLSIVEGIPGRARSSLISLKNMMGGVQVEATIGFGRQREGLLNKDAIRSLIHYFSTQQQETNITRLQVKGEGEEDIIDFISDQLKSSGRLDLSDNNIEAHYIERRNFIASAFRTYMDIIQNTYGTRS